MNPMTTPVDDDRFSRFDNSRLRWLPLAILLMTAIVLWLMWDRIPERWPVHYGLNGQPDAWATKTLPSIFVPVGVGLLMCGFFELLIKFNLAYPRLGRARQLAPEVQRAIGSLIAGFVRLIEVALAVVFAALALMLPLVRPVRPTLIILLVIICIAGAII